MSDNTATTATTVATHFRCDTCDAVAKIRSEQQQWRVANDYPMHCGKCYKQEMDQIRREDAISTIRGMNTPDGAGEFPVEFNTGGFVYQLQSATREPLYVGATRRELSDRPFEHKKQVWWGEVAAVRFWYYPTMDQVTAMERAMIRASQPRYNSHFVGSRDES